MLRIINYYYKGLMLQKPNIHHMETKCSNGSGVRSARQKTVSFILGQASVFLSPKAN